VSDLSEYCREIETHLCRKNDGHLMRIVGPSFEVVSRWAQQGIPLKVAMGGIDRYFERYYRKGPRRRPVKIDFCDADVLDLFDEWRRATGITASGSVTTSATDVAGEPARPVRKGPSLPEHLERVLLRLSNLRAKGVLGESLDPLIDRVSAELDLARARAGGVRGDDRSGMIERLARLDAEFLAAVRADMPPANVAAIEADAAESLAPFRATMDADAFAAAVLRAQATALRERLGLPAILFS
jgi:hypothetical protein